MLCQALRIKTMIQLILQIIFIILFVYLAINTLYSFIFALAGRIYEPPVYTDNPSKKRIAVLITSLREDHIILNTARKAKEHNYPPDHFEVFVAADSLQRETVENLRKIPVKVNEVQFELSSKARSLNQLLNSIPEDQYDIAIILDADNIMLADCLEKVNDAFQKGFKAVQSHRIAKNTNTPVAILDAISEEINNHIFRTGQRALGFSANTIGSGMAFEFRKIKEIYNKPGILGNPACDREVDFEIMKSDICIEFLNEAYVLDEKVSSTAVFKRQRTRWLESQIIHLRLFFSRHENGFSRTKNYWNKLFANLIPPRLIFLLAYFIVFVIFLVEKFSGVFLLAPSYSYWFALTAIYVFTFLISIPSSFYSLRTVHAILYIPVLIKNLILSLFTMRVNRKEFLHTPKAFTHDTR